jgi:hypothetical protein
MTQTILVSAFELETLELLRKYISKSPQPPFAKGGGEGGSVIFQVLVWLPYNRC